MKCERANVGRSRRRRERTNERTNRRKERRNSDGESGLDERNRERATGRWRALSKLERPGSFLLRARFHSRGNIGAPLFPFLFSTSPFSFRRFSFFSSSFFPLPFISFLFLFFFFLFFLFFFFSSHRHQPLSLFLAVSDCQAPLAAASFVSSWL